LIVGLGTKGFPVKSKLPFIVASYHFTILEQPFAVKDVLAPRTTFVLPEIEIGGCGR
jgi:hypothetical protein